MKRMILAVALLCAQPVHAATCHHYSRWYYPYPQTCRNSRYTAQFMFHNKLKQNVEKISLEVAPPKPILQWTRAEDFPKIVLTPNIVCSIKMSQRDLGLCLLKIEMEKRNGGAADK